MNKNVILAALIILSLFAVIALTSIFSFNYSLPFFGQIVAQTAATTCNETDGGVLFYKKGIISLCTGKDCLVKEEDFCTKDIAIEYYCSHENEIKTVNLKCPYGCDDGACLAKGQQLKPKPVVPEIIMPEEEKVKEIVCNERWTCADKTRLYQNVDCSWVKEEYCKYGCLEGECRQAGFWEKFLFWLNGQII